MKTTRSTYKKDKYYSKVTAVVDLLLKERHVVAPVEVFMQIGNLTKEDYENWRFGRIPYLERVIQGSLSKANRILHILRLHAQERGLHPSLTVYHKWGKGQKIRLQFSKSGNPALEELYSTHYVARPDANKRDDNTHSEDTNGQDHLDNDDIAAVAKRSRTRKKPYDQRSITFEEAQASNPRFLLRLRGRVLPATSSCIFLLMVGSTFAVLDKSGILQAAISRIVQAFGGKKYVLPLVIALFFMLLGAFFDIFEEVVPLVPLMIALSYLLGWDSLVGLGMSILATNMGFSAAITNPFTIGMAQKLAGLPLFSGAWLRIPIFVVTYAVLVVFLVSYARRVDRNPRSSPVFEQDRLERDKHRTFGLDSPSARQAQLGKATGWFAVFLFLILVVLIVGPFIPAISSLSLPLVGVLFLIGGIGAGVISGAGGRSVWKAVRDGMTDIAPSIPLILMAASIKHIVAQGGSLDTILHSASQAFSQTSPLHCSPGHAHSRRSAVARKGG